MAQAARSQSGHEASFWTSLAETFGRPVHPQNRRSIGEYVMPHSRPLRSLARQRVNGRYRFLTRRRSSNLGERRL
jgi:hypothetical protein